MEKIEQQYGLDKARELAKYQGVTSLTRPQALEIMETLWPGAPAVDKLAAAILCSSYGLNPLANHVFLIPFADRETGKDTWARVWGIKAKRLLATRQGPYSYLDMTPRLMTDEEQIKVWGAVDKANLCFMTWLQDMKTGARVYGYGTWPKEKKAKGTDKGNSQANMASIRSESQALDRLRPAEMPSGFAVAEEGYIESEGKVIDTGTGEIIEETKSEPLQQPLQEAPEQQRKPATDEEVDSIVQQVKDKKWSVAALFGWLSYTQGVPVKELSGLSYKEIVGKLTREQREALCSKLAE